MARKTLNYTIPADGGRDAGKVFVITEMPASRAEAWATRAILALIAGGKSDKDGKRQGVEVPEGFEKLGMAAMAELGIKALGGLEWDVAQPLLDEMWQCVKIMPDPTKPVVIRNLIEDDIEEIQTRIKIRMEIFGLHTDFFKAVARLNSDVSKGATAPV